MWLKTQKWARGSNKTCLFVVGFTHHNSSIVLANEDASAVVVVGHAGARSWRSREMKTKNSIFHRNE